MAHIREVARKKAPNGIAYEVHWREGAKKMQKTFIVRREAERFALKVETVKDSGETTKPLVKSAQTFRAVSDDLMAASTRLKPGTVAQYRNLLDKKILPRFGALKVSTITPADVEAWIADLVKDGLAPNTIHNHYVLLNKTFRYAARHRLIAYNPAEGVELPKNERSEGFAPVFLTATQIERLATALPQPYDTLIRFAAFTGLRAAEIAGLRVRDVNFAAGHIEVRQTRKRIHGEWTSGTPKSRRSTREVPVMSRKLTAELRALKVAHPRSSDPDALFWPGTNLTTRLLDYDRTLDVGRA
ncbi:tyrosine-type recombinase/integrase [Microbacterium paludicola]|uniref:tyrosine-type recombinase/integrase n=1 Tax=Microbacterium paludicola TaxID=300019 RepID=UPI0031DC82F9